MTELRVWVEDLIAKRYAGVATRLADAVGMSVSAFQRSTRMGTLNIENLLKLAEETGTPASDVLRRGDKGDVADLIERLYGPSAQPKMSRNARLMAEMYDELKNEGAKGFLLDSLREYLVVQRSRAQTAAPGDAKTEATVDRATRRGIPRR